MQGLSREKAESRIAALEEQVRRLAQEKDAALAEACQVREALLRSEAIFRRLAEVNLVGVGFGDTQGKVSFVNDEMLRMMGYTREDFEAGRINWLECLAPECRADHPRLTEALLRDGEISGYECAFLRPDGGRTPYLGTAALVTPGEDFHVSIALDLTKIRAAEYALRESDQRLRLAVSAAGLGVFEWAVSSDTARWENERMYEIFGRTREEGALSLEAFYEEVLESEDRETFDRVITAAMGREKLFRIACRIRRRNDGERRWIKASGRFEFEAEGSPRRFVGVIEDVTGAKLAEVAMAKQQELLQGTFDNIPVLLVMWNPHLQRFTLNRHAEAVLGWTSDDANDGNFMDKVYPDPDYAAEVAAYMHSLESGWHEWVCTTKGGEKVPIDWANIRLSDETMIGIGVDLREHKRAEGALRESEERLRLALDAAYVILFEWNIQRNEVRRFESREPALPATTADKLGTLEEVVKAAHPDDRELFKASVHDALEHVDGEYECEYRLLRPDGEIVWLNERGRVERDVEGRPVRLIGLSQDITERKRANEALKKAKDAADKANQAKSEFLATMSHEIRTPMTTFLMALDHLLQIDKSPERRHLLKMADQSARHLRSLIDDILDVARIESGKVEIEEMPFDLHACLRGAVDMFALAAQEKDLRLELQVAAEVPEMVVGDPSRLGQVLINLVGNAVKFTHEGQVRVSVRRWDDLLEFAVFDTGIGIPEEKCESIFKSFTQADGSLTRQYGGTGLGLAICKGLVELMGGEIFVRSKPGKCSVFTFTLPMRSAQGQKSTSAESVPEPAWRYKAAARILLAEDEPMIREMLTMMLATKGWQAETARSGREAVEKWAEGDFDIILMDLQMPEMDGLEATRKIRTGEAKVGRKTCIVGLTAHAQLEIEDACLKAGMDRVLTKPVRMAELYTVIDSCLSV